MAKRKFNADEAVDKKDGRANNPGNLNLPPKQSNAAKGITPKSTKFLHLTLDEETDEYLFVMAKKNKSTVSAYVRDLIRMDRKRNDSVYDYIKDDFKDELEAHKNRKSPNAGNTNGNKK